ncbi:MAG: MoaD/ThiS family protein [Actinomycetes bacterium]
MVSEAVRRFGPGFAELLPSGRIWLNGESVLGSTAVTDKDEVAVLPPVSGGCR